jgi:hypothetical protein
MDWFQRAQTWKESLSWVLQLTGTDRRCKDGACLYCSMRGNEAQEKIENSTAYFVSSFTVTTSSCVRHPLGPRNRIRKSCG